MEIPFIAWVFQGIPESIGTAAVVISLSTRELHWRLIIIIGLIYAVLMYTIRLLPLTFGVHTVLLIICLSLVTTWITRIDLRKVIIYTNIAIIILAVTEFLFVYLILSIGGYSLDTILSNSFQRILIGWPQVIVLFLVAIIYSKRVIY